MEIKLLMLGALIGVIAAFSRKSAPMEASFGRSAARNAAVVPAADAQATGSAAAETRVPAGALTAGS